jgi:hypothetical protein
MHNTGPSEALARARVHKESMDQEYTLGADKIHAGLILSLGIGGIICKSCKQSSNI